MLPLPLLLPLLPLEPLLLSCCIVEPSFVEMLNALTGWYCDAGGAVGALAKPGAPAEAASARCSNCAAGVIGCGEA